MPRVIHFEIPADDPSRAVRFYQSVFGWNFQKWEGPMDYWMVATGKDGPGIDGGLMKREQPGQTVNNVVGVASVDDTTKAVEKAGGRVVAPKSAVPGIGWVAYYLDTENNPFGVMQEDPSAR
jgi:predicted enzyme related to lactoylglutathione lyase